MTRGAAFRLVGLGSVTLVMMMLGGAGCGRSTSAEDADAAPPDGAIVADAPGVDGGAGDAGPSLVDRQQEVAAQSPQVDLLAVIDNSGSMGPKQAELATSFGALTAVLDDNRVSYRVGITTTDNGNPWCQPGSTTPENGGLVLSSCKTRLADFVFGATTDVRDAACNDLCALSATELEIRAVAPDAVPRPWLEHGPDGQNLPPGTSLAEALRCFLPQGVNGCGFEAPMEAMRRALQRASSSADPAHGFLRDEASLLVLFFTDEADCSYDPDWETIFAPDGNRVFWSDPTAAFPTSAVCWNAGVECTGDPQHYDDCRPADLDANGNPTTTVGAAVLHPVAGYVSELRALEAHKGLRAAGARVLVSLVAGVDAAGQPYYADASATDPAFQDSFGIGPGCIGPGGGTRAVPPVRLLELGRAFPAGSAASICSSDHAAHLTRLGARIAATPHRFCFDGCAADLRPQTALLDAECQLTEVLPSLEQRPIVPCRRYDDGTFVVDASTGGYTMPDADTDACFALLVDPDGSSADPADDLSPLCLGQGANLELAVARRIGVPAQAGATLHVTCRAPDPQPAVCAGTSP